MDKPEIEKKLDNIDRKITLLIKNAQEENRMNFAAYRHISNRVFLVLGFGLSLILTAIALIVNNHIFLLTMGVFVFIAGLLHSIALKLNIRAYSMDNVLYINVKKIGGWIIPFGKSWWKQFRAGLDRKNRLFVVSLFLETTVFLIISGAFLLTAKTLIMHH